MESIIINICEYEVLSSGSGFAVKLLLLRFNLELKFFCHSRRSTPPIRMALSEGDINLKSLTLSKQRVQL